MDFQEYKYVDVAKGGAFNRNKLCDLTLLGSPIGLKDTYMTFFRYNEEMKDYFNQNVKTNSKGEKYRSVTGYNGSAYCDWIPFDIDEQDLHTALESAREFIKVLSMYDIDTETCRYYFSGSKGFHIMIPSQMALVLPSKDIHIKLRRIAIQFSKHVKVDTSIYDKVRLFRLPNTINSKSGLYKIGLYSFEIMSMSVNEILELAKQPREELLIEEEYDINDTLIEWYKYSEKEKKFNKDTETQFHPSVKTKICMHEIMKGVSSGGRDNAGLRVVVHLRNSGLNKNMIYSALNEWNNSNDPPMDETQLNRIFQQGLNSYDFGCNDEILKKHCHKNCVFYKEHWGRFLND